MKRWKRWNKQATPMLVGYKFTTRGVDQIAVWCPYCRVWHVHGWDGHADTDTGHRVAHCLDGSPFRKGGYYIALEPETGKSIRSRSSRKED